MNTFLSKVALLGAMMLVLVSQFATAAPVFLAPHNPETCNCCNEVPEEPRSCCESEPSSELAAHHRCQCYVSAPTKPAPVPVATSPVPIPVEVAAVLEPMAIAMPRPAVSTTPPVFGLDAHPPNGPPGSSVGLRGPPRVHVQVGMPTA